MDVMTSPRECPAAGIFAWVIAVRQALDITTGRSVAVCALAQIPGLILMGLVLLAAPAP